MLYKPNSPNYEGILPPCHPVYCVAQCRSIFLSAKVSQEISALVPKCLDSLMDRVSRVRVTLTVMVRVSRVSVMVSVRDSVK